MRERLGFSLEEVAVAADVPAARLHEWEISGEVPAAAAPFVLGGLRRLERDARAAPPARYPTRDGSPSPDTPTTGQGLVARAVAYGDELRGWRQSAYRGAFYLLCVSLFGLFALLALAFLQLDFGYVMYAAGLVLLMGATGAAGGGAHHATAPLRERGPAGRLLAGLTVSYAALAVLLGMIAVGHAAFAFEWLDPALAARATSPTGAAAWIALGAVTGAAIAREAR